MPEFDSQFLERRRFLVQCVQATGAFFIASGTARPSAGPELHLHPHYREQTPLDAALLQINPGLDGFLSEQYHDKIAAILDSWTTGLLHSPQSVQPVEEHLDANFVGSSWQPVDSHPLRAGLAILELSPPELSRSHRLQAASFMAELAI